MDTIVSPREFERIFDRTSEYVNFKGAYSKEEIHRRIHSVEERLLQAKRDSKLQKTRRKYTHFARLLRTLRHHKFGEVALKHAIFNPKGMIGLTLQYGKRRAKEIRLRMGRRRVRRYGYRKN